MKNKLVDFLLSKIKLPNQVKIALPEDDIRVAKAIETLSEFGLTVVNHNEISDLKNERYVDMIQKLKFSKNWPIKNINQYLNDNTIKALFMLKNNEIDGVVSGSTIPSSDIIRNSLRIIGLDKNANCLSSMFLMIDKQCEKLYSFADCAVIPEPSHHQLSEIAEKTSELHQILTEDVPKIAFLSFSTKSSAEHYRVDNVRNAYKLFLKNNPSAIVEGELQLDAAINPVVAKRKIKNSKLKGNANILIFPNLDSGNIGYKLVQRFGDYYACGPLLLGLNQPVNDLSRGATTEDIILVALITAIQGELK